MIGDWLPPDCGGIGLTRPRRQAPSRRGDTLDRLTYLHRQIRYATEPLVEGRLLTVAEAAKVLRLSIPGVYGLLRSGVVPACRLGRAIRISDRVLQNYITAGGRAWPGGWRKRSSSGEAVMARILIRASGGGVRSLASRGSAVVVMEPPENRDSRDAALELGRTRNRLLLRESLVRTRLVVEAHELGDEASEVVLAQEEDVVEQLPAQGAREPFGERVHVRCLGCNPHDTRP